MFISSFVRESIDKSLVKTNEEIDSLLARSDTMTDAELLYALMQLWDTMTNVGSWHNFIATELKRSHKEGVWVAYGDCMPSKHVLIARANDYSEVCDLFTFFDMRRWLAGVAVCLCGTNHDPVIAHTTIEMAFRRYPNLRRVIFSHGAVNWGEKYAPVEYWNCESRENLI